MDVDNYSDQILHILSPGHLCMVYRKGDKYQNLQSRSQYAVLRGWFLFDLRNSSPHMNTCVAKSSSWSTPFVYHKLFLCLFCLLFALRHNVRMDIDYDSDQTLHIKPPGHLYMVYSIEDKYQHLLSQSQYVL